MSASSWRGFYKENTLKRIRRAASYMSIEVDVKALEKMTRDEVVLYISVPVGFALGTVAGLILGRALFYSGYVIEPERLCVEEYSQSSPCSNRLECIMPDRGSVSSPGQVLSCNHELL
jgi:hypothetical protein